METPISYDATSCFSSDLAMDGSSTTNLPPVDISCLSLDEPLQTPSTELLSPLQPEDEPSYDSSSVPTVLPATFLRTICDQLEFYFCDDNLLGDLYLLKHMTVDGYVKLELLASFGRVKRLTTDLELLKQALELSAKLLLSEDMLSVCRKDPLPYDQTYHGKLARTAIAYNLPEDASIAGLKETFRTCGEISYLRLLKKTGATGRNAVLKPPVMCGETYAIIEFTDVEMTNHAVLTLSDQYNWRTGMQVVLFDGTTTDKLKQRMFPVDNVVDRRRAKSCVASLSSSSSSTSTTTVKAPIHVDAVGEGLADLSEGKVSTGVVYSIRGAGGLITPSRQDGTSISFRLVPDEDGSIDIRQGDYVSFTVGKNKKSGRKYASKVKLEFRPPTIQVDEPEDLTPRYEPPMSEGRNRSRTVGSPSDSGSYTRGRSSSSGQRPRLSLKSPENSHAPLVENSAAAAFRQASGPDGTRGFGRRGSNSSTMRRDSNGGRRESREDLSSRRDELSATFAQDLAGRRRAASSGTAPPAFFGNNNGFGY